MSETGKGDYSPPTETREKKWYEIIRPSEVGYIPDLDGNYFSFLQNLTRLGGVRLAGGDDLSEFDLSNRASLLELRQTEVEWTGGDTKIVLLGDILGDRYAEGDFILDTVDRLNGKGANITITGGNHDIAAILSLAFKDKSKGAIEPLYMPLGEYRGILSPTRTKIDPKSEIQFDELYRNPRFVEHVRQIIKHYKVAEIIDDTLFTHGDFNPADLLGLYMAYKRRLARSTKPGRANLRSFIDAANGVFTSALKAAFPIINSSEGLRIDQGRKKDLRPLINLCDSTRVTPVTTFCCWPSKRYLVDTRGNYKPNNAYRNNPGFVQLCRENNIHALVFGHTSVRLAGRDSTEDLQIVPAHSGLSANQRCGCGRVEKSGQIWQYYGTKTDGSPDIDLRRTARPRA